MADQPKLAEELRKMEHEPLQPVEQQLIRWSLGIGILSLIVLYWVSATFFPGGH
jgi:hypothetical protein